jgi:peptide/nickel transport system permease protein
MANIAIPRPIPGYSVRVQHAISEARRYPILPIAILLLVLVIPGISADFIAPHSATVGSLSNRLRPPVGISGEEVNGVVLSQPGTWEHPLGTDKQGRDILSRIIHGARVSLTVAITPLPSLE